MKNNKKIILITVLSIIAILVIVGIITWIMLGTGAENDQQEADTSKINKLYSELMEKQAYTFTMTLNEENSISYMKRNDQAYLKSIYQGQESEILIKDGNSYLLVENQKTYYTYQNNETDLEKITLQLEMVKDEPYTEGKEKIEGKDYSYEEYIGSAEFLMKGTTAGEEAKTRFYFKGNKLEYIKTIVGDYEEILKINMSNQVDDDLFMIPSDYKEA